MAVRPNTAAMWSGALVGGLPPVCTTAAEAVAVFDRIGDLRRTFKYPVG